MRARIETERLVLRHLELSDASDVQRLCGNWNVARMLAVVPHPYPDGLAEEWIAGQDGRREAEGSESFAITRDGALIGVVGIDRRAEDRFELGYWIGEPWWGHGYATEAGRAVVDAFFEDTDTPRITSGHFEENAASGHVLEKLGFRYIGRSNRPCVARGHEMPSIDVELTRTDWETARA